MKKQKTMVVSMLCIIVMLLSTFSVYASGTFTDVKQGAWYEDEIDYAVENGIFNGTSATTFSPDTKMTRAQFVQVFANLSNVDTTNKNVTTTFTDVPSGKWYTAAIKWAVENGVVNGVGDGKFAPDNPVTREQMCVMLVNYVEKFQKDTLKTKTNVNFNDDAKIASWAKTAVYKCANAELVNGVGNNTFNPKGTTTRAQGATFFSNFHKYENQPETWFDKQGFKITPLTKDSCTNDDIGHVCYGWDTWAGFKETNLSNGNKSVSIWIPYYCFNISSVPQIVPFDRNTGVVINTKFREYDINGQMISMKIDINNMGGGPGDVSSGIICPADYDDVVFAVVYDGKINSELMQDFNTFYTVNQVIDFENSKCYFFSYNNE